VTKVQRKDWVNDPLWRKRPQIFSRFIDQCLAFASVYSVAKKEIKETAPLKDNLVLVFYTESVFIAESEGNIHCAIKNATIFI
jgi:hypothetical protein